MNTDLSAVIAGAIVIGALIAGLITALVCTAIVAHRQRERADRLLRWNSQHRAPGPRDRAFDSRSDRRAHVARSTRPRGGVPSSAEDTVVSGLPTWQGGRKS